MACSRPGIFGPRCGQPPVAIRMVSARTRAPLARAHGVGVFQHRAAAHQIDLEALQRRDIGRFQPVDFAILVGDQRRPTEGRLRNMPAETGGVLEFVRKPRGVDQKLFRHAAADHAGAADAEFLRHHHARAVTRRDARGAHAARARSNDKEIDVVIRHQPLSPALRNAGMLPDVCAGSRPPALKARGPFSSVRRASSRPLRRTACWPSLAQISDWHRRFSAARSISFLPTGDL